MGDFCSVILIFEPPPPPPYYFKIARRIPHATLNGPDILKLLRIGVVLPTTSDPRSCPLVSNDHGI